ncbi:DUF2125 domain-containing protein [Yoonia sediminilitoris]|uniref:DUF2125 domain-containing protein n=1 Tax=Yoonia sediminilitoris TaxID=1286148 RepID=A0A2T6KM57_9RHOB|nr:DUF2125 domain-containing protein [Yoonia sediminilitoris]PUB17299.1 hypothetical protein C8N45_102311 [Yoonia sediminilitoris]RCW97594.1 hypothetical protein DFP92_102311 [Yoonia sediminilitoris]
MKRLTLLVLIVSAIYSTYWFVGANTVESRAVESIALARSEGWDIAYDTIKTIGFPSRFDTTIDAPNVTPPDARWTWQAPFLQVFALSYQPNKIIAAFPNSQRLQLPTQKLSLTSDELRVSAGVRPNADLSFDALTTEGAGVSVSSDIGWSIALQNALIALRNTPDMDKSYDAYAQINNLSLPSEFLKQLNQGNNLPAKIDSITINSQLGLNQTLDRHTKNPQLQSITLENAQIVWGTLSVRAEGRVDIDSTGVPTGRITLITQDWRTMIDILVSMGQVQPGIAETLRNMAGGLANDAGVLELPVSFGNGFMSLGPIPLGPAPRLR